MKKAIKNYFTTTNWVYLLLCVLVSVISVATLVSVGQYGGLTYTSAFGNMRPAVTQAFASVLGLCCAVVLSLIPFKKILKFWPFFAVACWVLVLLTFVPGVGYQPGATGSQSWIAMPFGMSFQPTEIAKISFYISFAVHLNKVRPTLNHPKNLLLVLVHLLLPVLLVHFQGDDGTAMVFLVIGVIMLFMAGINRWVVVLCATAMAAALPLLWRFVLTVHQKERIIGLFWPQQFTDTTMHQQLRGRVAIGAGQLFGRGLFQPNHYYVPRPENDFIFSYFAQSCGFIGCLILFGLLFGIMVKTLQTAGTTQNRTGAYVCVGVFATLLFQTVVNLGMNLMLLPVMGVTLPFMSAGGTSVLMLYLSVGLVLSVWKSYPRTGLQKV
ncbi:FtsW/RodA/SpoVE family cell cycle protein [Ruminococcaceae bacterium OttesenSCG-928-A16]|nr:FtsW/RodA/SpoVE family cell cycle protein [Ruminococcaceae bacterium OttesenSCG-928-A16]